jgi:23S rRNA G2069 N7-methylase RlmK/C1962 C5-methylase RlmI
VKQISLPAFAAAFVAGGGRDIDTTRLTIDGAAGEHVQLVDPTGEDLGLAIVDADNARLRVMVTPADGLPKIDGALLGVRVERALAWRRALGLTGAYRLLHGAGDGLPGFAGDVLGDVAVVYVYAECLRALERRSRQAARERRRGRSCPGRDR